MAGGDIPSEIPPLDLPTRPDRRGDPTAEHAGGTTPEPELTPAQKEAAEAEAAKKAAGDTAGLREVADTGQGSSVDTIAMLQDAANRALAGEDRNAILNSIPEGLHNEAQRRFAELDSVQKAEPQAAGAGEGEPPQGSPEAVAATPDDEKRRELERLAGKIGDMPDDRENLGQQAPQVEAETLREVPQQSAQQAGEAPEAEQRAQPETGEAIESDDNLQRERNRAINEEWRDFKKQLGAMDVVELNDEYDEAKTQYDDANAEYFGTLQGRSTPQERAQAKAFRDELKRRRDEIKTVLRTKQKGTSESATAREKTQTIENRAKEAKRLSTLDVTSLEGEVTGVDAEIKSLEEQLAGTADRETKDIIQDRLNDAQARKGIVENTLKTKQGEKEEQGKKQETESAKAGHEQALKDNTEPAWFEEMLGQTDQKLKDNQGEINEIERVLEGLADGPEKESWKIELVKAQKTAAELNKEIKFYREGLGNAQKRAREEQGHKQSLTPETSKVMSATDFENSTESDQIKYLMELANAYDRPGSARFNELKNKLKGASNLTFEESGLLVKELSESLFKKGRQGKTMELLHLANAKNPALALAVLERFSHRKEVQKQIDEALPGVGKKIWEFAKKNPGWMMLLLAILAGGAAAVAAVAGPGLGVAAGLGGAGAASGGGYGIASRRGW